MKKDKYRLTKSSCYLGIFVQAIVCNITAILFIPMMDLYGFSYVDLGILVAINFIAQVSVDIGFSGVIDKWGYKKLVLPANICGFVGLILFALTPYIFKENIFLGIAISTTIFAASSGLLELLVSPMVDALPSDDKGSSMSLMHSFYAWGQVATIIVTTLFIFIFGGENWQVIVLIWAIVPLINFFMFRKSHFPKTIPHNQRQDKKSVMFHPFYLIALVAIFAGGATEVTMAQWSSTFMERALEIPKVAGDLIGLCGFAIMMGVGRLIYGIYGAKLNMNNVLIFGAIVSAICYVVVALSPNNIFNVIACIVCGLSASLLWPGTLVVSSAKFPVAGAWMFAFLAAAGDLGAAFGPYLTGLIADNSADMGVTKFVGELVNTTPEQSAIRTAILIAGIFPLITIVCQVALKKAKLKR